MAEEGAEKQEECEAEVKSKRQFEVNKQVKIKLTYEKREQVAKFTWEAEVEIKENKGKYSLFEVIGKASLENLTKEGE